MVCPAVCQGQDGFFGSYGVLKDYLSGAASGEYHCDGGPSAVFMALTVSGERCLEVEAVNPTTGAVEQRIRVFCKPGYVYVSSPACFWHRVMPVNSTLPGPQRTLILRGQCLEWRHSGGMEREDGSRSGCFFNRECEGAREHPTGILLCSHRLPRRSCCSNQGERAGRSGCLT